MTLFDSNWNDRNRFNAYLTRNGAKRSENNSNDPKDCSHFDRPIHWETRIVLNKWTVRKMTGTEFLSILFHHFRKKNFARKFSRYRMCVFQWRFLMLFEFIWFDGLFTFVFENPLAMTKAYLFHRVIQREWIQKMWSLFILLFESNLKLIVMRIISELIHYKEIKYTHTRSHTPMDSDAIQIFLLV